MNNSKNDTFVISGRARRILEEWLKETNIGIVAEHGMYLYKDGVWELMTENISNEFIERLLPVFELFSDRLPRSSVEIKEFSICLHYRNSDPGLAEIRAREFYDYLINFCANIPVQVVQGDKVIEVRPSGNGKGFAVQKILAIKHYDFIIAFGDDTTDEDMFKALPENAYSVRVGIAPTVAHYRLYNYLEVRKILNTLTEID